MNSHFHSIPQNKAPQILNLIVEISRGDFIKYEYNHELGILEVDRVLFGPVHFPIVYCDVPQTWNKEDDDPLDAVVFTSGNIVPGALVKGRVIGVMEMEDNGEMDNKIITVNEADPRYKDINHVDQLRPFEKKDMQTFFETYKYAQTGPGTVKVGNFLGPQKAYELIEQAIQDYREKFKVATSKA